jgi:hypothetical protein
MLEPPISDLPQPRVEDVVSIPGCAVGWASRPNERAQLPRVYRTDSGACLVVLGTPLALGAQVQTKLANAAAEGADAVSRLAPELDGAFALIYLSPAENTLTICTDFLGLQPLYWHRGCDFLLVASSATSLARTGLFRPTLNPGAWGSLLHYGATFGDATLSNEIERVPASSVAVWHVEERKLSVTERPWWPTTDRSLKIENFDTKLVVEAFQAEIESYRQWYPDPTLLLSGGADSRLILALLSRTGCNEALTVSHPDVLLNANGRFADAVGKAFVKQHRRVPADKDYFSSQQYFDFLQVHEIAAPSAGLFIANLFPAVRKHGAPAYWDGLLPHIHLSPVATGQNEDLHAYTTRVSQSSDSTHVRMAASLFRRPQEIIDGFHSQLALARQWYGNEREEIARFFVQNRTRNRVSKMPLQAVSTYGQALTPGISRRAFSTILALPAEERQDHKLYHRILEHHFPEFLAYPIVSRGEFRLTNRTSAYWSLFAAVAGLQQNRLVQRVLSKMRGDPGEFFRPSKLVQRASEIVDIDHPDLNPDGVRAITNPADPSKCPWPRWYAKQFLFYWKMWRDQMDGNVAKARMDYFGEG